MAGRKGPAMWLRYGHIGPIFGNLLARSFLSQFLCQVHGLGIDAGSQPQAQSDVQRSPSSSRWLPAFTQRCFRLKPVRVLRYPVFLDRKARLNNLSPAPAWGTWLPYGNCATVFAAAQVVGGVLMIPEVRVLVKGNPQEIFAGSLVPHSLPSTIGSVAPSSAATMAPSPGATNTQVAPASGILAGRRKIPGVWGRSPQFTIL